MTAISIPIGRPRGFGGVFILALVFFGLVAGIQIILNPHHPYQQHLSETEQARNCLEQNGPWKVYYEKKTDNYHFLCQDSFGTVFDVIAKKITDALYQEITSFSPKGGVWETIERWLFFKGARPAPIPPGPYQFIPAP